ncbi:hypothetical protein [Pseudoroseicyclus aestuarii]|uniref:Uncharacterized protein n=1 Tax=Pseudoroseicyclus aestuarii TaxID=1795041 RepID=A0A318SV49_9RHOB|nr:hypothetical protein [Pseudoroseicyclus aestuarii]PYE85372.1 hypothetical protein DFP88_10137 [Pseudoroseicyclus aestuarii]
MNALDATFAALAARGVGRAPSALAAEALFRATPALPKSKTDITTAAARAIIDAETERRKSLTQRLRDARQVRDASAAL